MPIREVKKQIAIIADNAQIASCKRAGLDRACGVKAKALGEKCGFPLRVAAEGYYGSDGVKWSAKSKHRLGSVATSFFSQIKSFVGFGNQIR